MPENVKVPGVGNVDRKWVIAGLGGVAAIVVYAYWRRSQAPEEEPLGEGETYLGDEWSPDAYIGADTPGGQTYTPEVRDDIVNTNAEWAQRVVDLLEGVGYDRNLAAATIGKYLAGQPLTATEKILVQAAIGLLGNPPAGAIPIWSIPTPPTTPTPTTPKPTPKPGTDTPRGDRVNTTQSLTSYARHFSSSTSAASIEGTKRQILTLNPWLKRAIIGPPGKPFRTEKPVQRGWIIIVPRGIQR